MKHPFFNEVDIESIMTKKMKAPFIPKIENNFDLSNFDNQNLDIKQTVYESTRKSNIKDKQYMFNNFS